MEILPCQSATLYTFLHSVELYTTSHFQVRTAVICRSLGIIQISSYFHKGLFGNWYTSCSLHNTYHTALTPRLEQVLCGIRKEQARTRPRVRLPIAVHIMTQIYSVLEKSPTDYQSIMLWAACCTAFFGFLRVGKMTLPSQQAYDSSVHLSLNDVALDNRSNPTIIWLMIKQSETDPFRMGVNLCLGRTASVVCLVKAVLPYLALRGRSPGPLFAFEDDTSLTRTRFKSLLSAMLKLAGLDDS